MKRIYVGLFFILLVITTSAAVPHTFQAGQPASAAEVNANFSDVDTRIDTSLGGIFIGQYTASDGSGVASVLCPVDTIVGSAQCGCDYASGTRNLGVLFSCQVVGNGGVAGCFPEAATYNPGLPSPLATLTLVCVSGVQNDGTPITPVFSKVGLPASAKIKVSGIELEAEVDGIELDAAVIAARDAVAGHKNALQSR